MLSSRSRSLFFFFNDTATTEIYTLSLHDALPIYMTLQVVERAMQLHGGGGVSQEFPLASMWAHMDASGNSWRSEEHTSELQSRSDLVCRLLLEKKKIYYSCNTCVSRHAPGSSLFY